MKSDVVIVGAGLAGLCAAITIQRAGFHPVVIDGADRVGGRVRTDHVDGYTLDHGFQVFNPAYPTAKALLNYDELQLKPFSPGVRVVRGSDETLLGNPLRDVSFFTAFANTFRAKGFSGFSDVSKFGIYAGLAASKTSPDVYDCTAREALRRAGMSEDFVEHTLKPFLTGVFLEDCLETSRRTLDFVLEFFIKGVPAVPARGMSAIPLQLSSLLHSDSVLLNTWAHRVSANQVQSDAGTLDASAVILASDFETAHAWLGTNNHSWRSVTTWYHTSNQPLMNGKALLSVDGNSAGPAINTVPLTNTANTYAPEDKVLISSSTLGTDTSTEMENRLRHHLAHIYRTNTDDWTLIGVRSVERALPSSLPPMHIHNSVPCVDGVFMAGDHLRQPSIEAAMASGVAAGQAAIAKIRGR